MRAQAVENAGAFGDKILASLGEQPENLGLLVWTNPSQAPITPGGERRKGRVQLIVLAPMADGEHPDARRELRRHINHFLFGTDQPLGKGPSQTVSTLDRPPTLGKTLRPPLQRLQASVIRPKLHVFQQFAVLIQDGDSIGSLVRIDPDQYLHPYGPPFK